MCVLNLMGRLVDTPFFFTASVDLGPASSCCARAETYIVNCRLIKFFIHSTFSSGLVSTDSFGTCLVLVQLGLPLSLATNITVQSKLNGKCQSKLFILSGLCTTVVRHFDIRVT